MVAGPAGGHGRVDELEKGPLGQVAALLQELFAGDDDRPRPVPAVQGGLDERIGSLVVAGDERPPGAQDDAARGVGQGQNVEPVVPADPVQNGRGFVAPAFSQALAQKLPGRALANDVTDRAETVIVDHPGRGQIMADLGLGQGDDRPVLEPGAEKERNDSADADDGQEPEDHFAPKRPIEKTAAQGKAGHAVNSAGNVITLAKRMSTRSRRTER